MSKKSRKREAIVYSTNPNYEYEYEENKINTLKPGEQNLKICVFSKKIIFRQKIRFNKHKQIKHI